MHFPCHTFILLLKHTPHSDLRLSNQAKCSNLPSPRNIRYTASKRCKIARKVKDGQRKGKVFCEFTFDIKEKLNRGRKEVDEVLGGILHNFLKDTFYVCCWICKIAFYERVAELFVKDGGAF